MVYLLQRGDAPVLVYMSLMDSADDKSKFERVYQSYKGLMFYTANRILNNPQDAEDAVHTAFVKIAENISKIQEASRFPHFSARYCRLNKLFYRVSEQVQQLFLIHLH